MVGGLEGAVAVVTGGASGIGEACCSLLTASGATVYVADLAAEPPLDVTDRAALDELAARLDRLDILINAAGVLTENKPVDELAPDDFRKTSRSTCSARSRLARRSVRSSAAGAGRSSTSPLRRRSSRCPGRRPIRRRRERSRR